MMQKRASIDPDEIVSGVTRWRQPIAQIFTDVALNLRHGTDPEEVAAICDAAAEMIENPAATEKIGRRLMKKLSLPEVAS